MANPAVSRVGAAPPPAATRAVRARRRADVALAATSALGLAFALFLYPPLRPTAFEMVDFGEFLPLLRSRANALSGLTAMLSYYAGHGRFNPVTFAAIVLKWELFGTSSVGWQLVHFATMAAVALAAFVLLRRLGGSRAGAAAGALLFVVARPAAHAWLKLHVGEPLGTALFLAAVFLALRIPAARRWVGLAALLGLLLALATLAKETLVAVVPFCLAVALSRRQDGSWGPPALDRRTIGVVGVVGAVVFIVAALPILLVRAAAPASAYAASYGLSSINAGGAAEVIGTVVLPGTTNPLAPANAAYLLVIVAGWAPALRRRRSQREDLVRLAVAGTLVASGALVYLPWPDMQAFYAFPYLLGPALLLAIAVTRVEERAGNLGRGFTLAAVVVSLLFLGKWAHWRSRAIAAARDVGGELVREIARHPQARSVVVAVPEVNRWRGDLIQRFVLAMTGAAPTVTERTCGDVAPTAVAAGGALAVVYSMDCPMLLSDEARRTLRRTYTYLDGRLRLSTDSVRVDVWVPAPPLTPVSPTQ